MHDNVIVGRTVPSFRIAVEKEKILVAPMEIIDNKKCIMMM